MLKSRPAQGCPHCRAPKPLLLHQELGKALSQSSPNPPHTSPDEAPGSHRMAGPGCGKASFLWAGGQKPQRGQQVPGKGRNPSFGLGPAVSPFAMSWAVSASGFLWLQNTPEHVGSAPPGVCGTQPVAQAAPPASPSALGIPSPFPCRVFPPGLVPHVPGSPQEQRGFTDYNKNNKLSSKNATTPNQLLME